MRQPLVSIVIPTYNSAATLERTVHSIFRQEYTPYEIIIVDDGSTDATAECVANLRHAMPAAHIQFVQQPHQGQSVARNTGMAHAGGEYIAFLDSDDAWHRQKLAIQIAIMREQNAVLCGTVHRVIRESELSELLQMPITMEDVRWHAITWPRILFKTPFATPSVIIHKRLGHYVFDKSLHWAEDYHLWKRIIHDYAALKIEYPLTYTFKHNYLSQTVSRSTDLLAVQQALNQGDRLMFCSEEYAWHDKFFIALGFVWSQLKFIKRLFCKMIYELRP